MGCSLSKLPSTSSTSSALNTLRTLHSAAASAQRKFAHRTTTTTTTTTTNHHPALLRILREISTFVGRGSDRFFTYNCWTGDYRAKNVGALTTEAARLTAALQVAVREIVRDGGPAYTLSDGSRIERRLN